MMAGAEAVRLLTGHSERHMIRSRMEDTVSKATSMILGDHFEQMIAQQVQTGRYGTASEVVRDALRLFEERQTTIKRMNEAIEEGYASGFIDEVDWDALEERAEQATNS